MIVAGVMSGTSVDGINVQSVEALSVTGGRGQGARTTRILWSCGVPVSPIRFVRAILGMMNAELARVADLARLNFLLGELYFGGDPGDQRASMGVRA